jgi:hypothetical protein
MRASLVWASVPQRFLSLTEFCKHLGRTGVCHVDETEKGWWKGILTVAFMWRWFLSVMYS